MLSEILIDAQHKFTEIIDFFKSELSLLRVGRASPSLVEDIVVEAYGTKMTLKELATISSPDSHLLNIAPWDKSLIGNIVTAIRSADLGVEAIASGDVIRVPIPQLSEERRKELIKKVSSLAEEARIKVRQIRQEELKLTEDLEKSEDLSQDDLFRFKQDLQSLVEEANKKIESLKEFKEKELL